MLSDGTIRALLDNRTLVIDPPPTPQMIQPASVDLTLGASFCVLSWRGRRTETILLDSDGYFELNSHECALACTAETVELPGHIMARVEGKSTWGRRFLMIHSTAGFIDPGFRGQITLELKNLSPMPLKLPIYQPIAQISFDYLDAPALRPYGSPGLGSKYQGQTGVTAARL